MSCRVCEFDGVREVYAADHDRSFTSELKPIRARVRVGTCDRCGHCQTLDAPPGGTAQYYQQTYDLLTGSDDEDDLFDVKADGTPIYRQQVELSNLEELVRLPERGRVLDYGCGKGAFLRRFLTSKGGWIGHGFDMSERYRPFLEKTIPAANFAVGSLQPLRDQGTRFDLIVMFQVVEHLEKPWEVLTALRELLSDQGLLYVTVPSLLAYSVDMFIADHLSHFTPPALDLLMMRCGFWRAMSSETHQAGQITACYRPEPDRALRNVRDVGPTYREFISGRIEREMASWKDFAERTNRFLEEHAPVAIYGAGAAGAFLKNACFAARPEAIQLFLDRNPFKAGKTYLDLPIAAPSDLPGEIRGVVAALNPYRARRIIEQARLPARIPVLYPA